MPLILEYEAKDTPVHRMNINTKAVITACSVLLGTFWWNLRFLLPLLVFVVTWMTLAKVPRNWLRTFGILIALSIPPTIAYVIFMTSPEFFKVLPKEFVEKTLIAVHLWGIKIGFTYGNLYWLVANTVRILVILFAIAPFIYSTSQSDLIDWLRNLKIPMPVIFVLMTGLRFFPLLLARAQTIITAQKLRGWRVTSRNPAKLVKQIKPIAIPITSFVVHLADRVTISVVTRGFGSTSKAVGWIGERFKMGVLDWFICIAYPAFTAYALYLLFFHNIGAI